jgi:hypothetical protein
MKSAGLPELLHVLIAHDVEFIIVGMTAGVLQGAPTTTFDLDIVHRRTPDNVARLLQALGELDAVYRHDPRKLRPKESHLVSPGHQLLSTTHGDLDCLGTIDEEKTYEDLLGRTVEIRIATDAMVRALDLKTLIEFKEKSGRPKDLAVLPVLRATLDEIERGSQ